MKKNRHLRNVIFLLCVLSALLSVSIYAYLYRGTSIRIEKTIASRKIVRAAENARMQGKEIVKLYDSTAEERAQLPGFFVIEEASVDAIQAIEAIGPATKTDVSISSIRSAKPGEKDDPKVGSISAHVSAKGAWSDVMKALKMFENLRYENSISLVTLTMVDSGDGKNPSSRKWELSFEIAIKTLHNK